MVDLNATDHGWIAGLVSAAVPLAYAAWLTRPGGAMHRQSSVGAGAGAGAASRSAPAHEWSCTVTS
ncbi:hypothetical protein GCM10027079_07300 [Sediminivirga luteola]|uniref:Uncharacterized protein n=1 Tax=Sediminivirga luteola TaxID=1774748 RepID=A0A8J2XLX5_9MICO|nr:hypothetical protein GCM10011333_31940 [Sediminivirga luteola]